LSAPRLLRPLPFTIVIATAAAFNYPRARLLGFNVLNRAIRFTVLGVSRYSIGARCAADGEYADLSMEHGDFHRSLSFGERFFGPEFGEE
jgi:hypothetical protein